MGGYLVQPLGAQKKMRRPGGRRGMTLPDSSMTPGPGVLPWGEQEAKLVHRAFNLEEAKRHRGGDK